MRTVYGILCFTLLNSVWAADEPTAKPIKPVPEGKGACDPKALLDQKLQLVADECVCAVYPYWTDGTNFLYYSEICNQAPGCELTDIVYYWDDLLNWPVGTVLRVCGWIRTSSISRLYQPGPRGRSEHESTPQKSHSAIDRGPVSPGGPE